MRYNILMVTTLSQVKNSLGAYSQVLRRDYKVEKIGIFGSIVRGNQTQNSDIDMLVEFSSPPSIFKFIELEEKLNNILGKKNRFSH